MTLNEIQRAKDAGAKLSRYTQDLNEKYPGAKRYGIIGLATVERVLIDEDIPLYLEMVAERLVVFDGMEETPKELRTASRRIRSLSAKLLDEIRIAKELLPE